MKFKFFIIVTLLFFTLTTSVHAQTAPPSSVDGIIIITTPENPTPGQSVKVTLQDYQTDINKATITWLLDKNQYAKGVGLTSITVTAPASGKKVNVMAIIETPDGADIKKVLNIKSGDIDMIWETGGYVPPLYRGKAQFSYQNLLKVVAVPHFMDSNGKQVKPSQLVYKWTKDDTVLQSQSGFGKQSIIIKGDIVPRPFTINVEVSSPNSDAHGVGELTFEAVAPTIKFYEDDPLYGVLYNKSIGDVFPLSHSEVKIQSAPYGFNLSSGLTYEWSVNGVTHDELASNTNIVLKISGTDQGKSDISLTMKNIGDDILQNATVGFSAVFNGKKQSSPNVTF